MPMPIPAPTLSISISPAPAVQTIALTNQAPRHHEHCCHQRIFPARQQREYVDERRQLRSPHPPRRPERHQHQSGRTKFCNRQSVRHVTVIAWPVVAGFTLERTAALAPAAWAPVTNGILTLNDTNFFNTTNSRFGPVQFFRLKMP